MTKQITKKTKIPLKIRKGDKNEFLQKKATTYKSDQKDAKKMIKRRKSPQVTKKNY